ncbi:TPA: RNA-directed DNA polymerase [Pseudomonas aeruginosa]|nr:RNA-directed DNA polymerase [Pseudomonas aeruginosa]
MSVVDARYDRLFPRRVILQDEVVLAQAWKKTHTFIRQHNWYADTLELDASAVCLASNLSAWSQAIADGTYKTAPAWLVPAPKNGLWTFKPTSDGGWAPRISEGEDSPVLRPLAHIGIREQTVATAVMLCLADCIESAQGDTSLPALEASASGVFSYGNRLFCTWSNDHAVANFSWGNSNTYSRYFQDYQRFVERPIAVATAAEDSGAANVFIVSLDISAFFDNIDVELLVKHMRGAYEAFAAKGEERKPSSESFWKAARSALTFQWRTQDKSLAGLFRDGVLPAGLPQGLVSSGFFANAYLLEFDRAVGNFIGKRAPRKGFHIHDYCRYVDDLRLVISTDQNDGAIGEAELNGVVSEWIQGLLKKHTTPEGKLTTWLRLNIAKTQIERLGEVGGDSRTAARMKALQQQLSGPFDLDSLRQTEAGLNGLLSLAELGLIEESASPRQHDYLRLASVAKTKLEVRDDTLTRFSAYRLVRSLRMRRSMTDLTETNEDEATKDGLIHDFQAAARRLVSAWAVNPSLVQVLRYALDLYPSTELLEPVSQALLSKVQTSLTTTDYERRVAYYVFADLFKAGATETGWWAEQDMSFSVADVDAYREALAALAAQVLELSDVPWYVQQQGSLLLAALRKPTIASLRGSELRFHRVLQSFVSSPSSGQEMSTEEDLVISLVGHQLLRDVPHYISWFQRFCVGKEKPFISHAWKVIAETSPDLFAEISVSKRAGMPNLAACAPKYLAKYSAAKWVDGFTPLPARKWLPLIAVTTHPTGPFSQENALLKLALALGQARSVKEFDPELLTPLNVQVRSDNWEKLNDPRFTEIEVRAVPTSKARDRAYETPSWCMENDAWMYAFGRLLRSAATGEADFTARHWLAREDVGWYRGLRSTWHKRRTGMLHTAEALRGTAAAITPWFSSLLLLLLRWPGIAEDESSAVAEIRTRRDFKRVVRARLEAQAQIYGSSSNLPIYRYPIEWPLKSERGLRVAMVQGLMPLHDHFSLGLDGFEAPGYREKHRNHTAALLHLAIKHLAARDYVLGLSEKPHFDLVVFPELTIHVDDQDLMRAFSDATGAMLFYGLLGAREPGTNNPINTARWLVPQRRSGRRSWVEVDQGKYHLTPEEQGLGISSWRPYQVVIELLDPADASAMAYRLTGSICFDATDLALAADLRDESHMYVVAAMNKDVKTFDGMVAALRYHMYQHVLIANIGEFGGSTAQAPYDKEHRRLISHSHGSEQLAISVFDVRMEDFGPELEAAKPGSSVTKTVSERIGKAPPAGLKR